MKIDIGMRIINNAAESRMRLAKARQAMDELREHEREFLLAEILEVEELKVIRAEGHYVPFTPPEVAAMNSISKIPDSPGTRHAVGGLTSFGIPVEAKCACGHSAHAHDGSGLVCGLCTCPAFTANPPAAGVWVCDPLRAEETAKVQPKVKTPSHVNRVTSKKTKTPKKKR